MSSVSDVSLVTNQIPISMEFPREIGELANTLSLVYNRIANTLNTKEGGLISAQEYQSSQQYNLVSSQSFKNVYRKAFDMVALNGGPIAPGATVSFPHGIVSGITASIVSVVQIYGGATNSDAPVKYLPLPYVSATLVTDQVQIYLTPLTVVLVNGATQTALTNATIVAYYLKN